MSLVHNKNVRRNIDKRRGEDNFCSRLSCFMLNFEWSKIENVRRTKIHDERRARSLLAVVFLAWTGETGEGRKSYTPFCLIS